MAPEKQVHPDGPQGSRPTSKPLMVLDNGTQQTVEN